MLGGEWVVCFPGSPEMFWELGTPTDLITNVAQVVPHRAQGSEAKLGPSLCSVTTFSQPDPERLARHSFPGGQGRVRLLMRKVLPRLKH